MGALPIPADSVPDDLTVGGDWRWINRGAVDLLGENPDVNQSAVLGLPKAQTLYGPLPQQLQSPDSFASQLKQKLAAREKYHIPAGQMLAVPQVNDPSVCVLVMKLPDNRLAITALNYNRNSSMVTVDLSNVPGTSAGSTAKQTAHDIVADQDVGTVSDTGQLNLQLDSLSGQTVVVPQAGS